MLTLPKPIISPRATEYKIDGVKLRDFFEKEFVKLLDSQIGNVKFEHVCLVKLGEKEEKHEVVERFVVGHSSSRDDEKSILTIGARTPDGCEKLLGAITKFLEKKQSG